MNTIEKLRTLHNFLTTIPESQIHMDSWYVEGPDCGTVGCAMGWACTIPEFKALGLGLDAAGNGAYAVRFDPPNDETGEETKFGFTAAARFFGINGDQAHYLFNPQAYVERMAFFGGYTVCGVDHTDDPKIYNYEEITRQMICDRICNMIRYYERIAQ